MAGGRPANHPLWGEVMKRGSGKRLAATSLALLMGGLGWPTAAAARSSDPVEQEPEQRADRGPPEVQSGGPYLPFRMEKMLKAQASLADDDIEVRLKDDTIILDGAVDGLGERQLAEALVRRHKPARLHVRNALIVVSRDADDAGAQLRRLSELARLARARSHAPEIRQLADRVLADAALAGRALGIVDAPRPSRQTAPAALGGALDELDGLSLNLVLLDGITQQIAATVSALERLEPPVPGTLDSAVTELRRDRQQAEQIRALFQPGGLPASAPGP